MVGVTTFALNHKFFFGMSLGVSWSDDMCSFHNKSSWHFGQCDEMCSFHHELLRDVSQCDDMRYVVNGHMWSV